MGQSQRCALFNNDFSICTVVIGGIIGSEIVKVVESVITGKSDLTDNTRITADGGIFNDCAVKQINITAACQRTDIQSALAGNRNITVVGKSSGNIHGGIGY